MGRRHRSPSDDYSYTEDYSESRSRSRRRHRSRRHRHGHKHRRRERDHHREDRGRRRGRSHGRREDYGGAPPPRGREGRSAGGGGGGNAGGCEGGTGDWQHDLKDFIRKNRVDERTQDALYQLSKRDAIEVMGTDGGKNSFILDENVRNPDAVIMSRIRRLGDKGGAF
mmetsp:Transcript_34029/g.97878  ORF Transcript_34029/g.97878 Transcript_34029/m.97878 type:complete len:168 (-) Transcript_34029:52-555(-)